MRNDTKYKFLAIFFIFAIVTYMYINWIKFFNPWEKEHLFSSANDFERFLLKKKTKKLWA